eukprot:6144165-Ditylum_brightwellii.AAC.1
MLAWGSWNWRCSNSHKNNECVAAVKGLTDPQDVLNARRNLIDNVWPGQNRQRNHEGTQRTRRHNCKASVRHKENGVKNPKRSKYVRLNKVN